MMGLEEHLLAMFRDDFEFHDGAGASHLGAGPRRMRRRTPPQTVRCRYAGLGQRRRERTAENPVLRARQGATQHRTFRQRTRPATITIETLVRCQSALRPLTRNPLRVVVVTMDSHLAGAAARAAAAAEARFAGPDAGDARGRRVGQRSGGAGALQRRHRPRRHRYRDHAVPRRSRPRGPAGAGGPPRPLRRHGLLHVRRRGRAS